MVEMENKKTITLVKLQTSNAKSAVQQRGLALGKPNARPLLVACHMQKSSQDHSTGSLNISIFSLSQSAYKYHQHDVSASDNQRHHQGLPWLTAFELLGRLLVMDGMEFVQPST